MRVAADVLGVSYKELESLVETPGERPVAKGRQGRQRTIDLSTVEVLALAFLLRRDLGAPGRRALRLARDLSRAPTGSIALGGLGSLHFDLERLRSLLREALAGAIENHVPVRRGRPRTARK